MLGMPTIALGSKRLSILDLGSTLKLWLRGDLGVSGASPITNWADQSAQANHGANITGTPTLVTGGLNGKSGIRIQSGQGITSTTANVVPANSARTVFYVVNGTPVGNGGQDAIFTFRRNTGLFQLLAGGFGGPYVYTGGGGPNATCIGLTNGVASIFETTYDGSGLIAGMTMKQNGSALTLVGSTVESDNGATGYAIGAGSVNDCSDGTFYEIIVCDTVLSATNLTFVRNYLKARYGL